MTTTDYLINAVFVVFVLLMTRERRVDLRSLLVPLAIVVSVGQHYIHSIPTAGSDLVLVGLVTGLGLAMGVAAGFATHVRLADDGVALSRVGWIAGGLLIAGMCARMLFVLAVNNGAGPAIRSFSIANHIGAAAWPVALVGMALVAIVARIVTVQIRARRLTSTRIQAPVAIGAQA
jgi:hypothetical protein